MQQILHEGTRKGLLACIKNTPTPGPTREPTPTPGPYRAFNKKLAYGSKGDDVQLVQQRLKDLGFFTYKKITNGYYKNTQKAVEDFQKHNGLEVTGIVDEYTWNALFNDPDVADVLSPARTYEPTPPQYFFEVDVNNQAVKVWRYNRETKGYTDLDRAFICATGTTKYPSPLGTFTLSGRKSPHCKFPTWGGGEARWWTKITEEIAFHSVLYGDSGDDSTLKVASFNGLGKRGSHGCIRMTVADAKWIYQHAEKGMQVWIHEDGADDPELKYMVKPGALNTKTMMPEETPAETIPAAETPAAEEVPAVEETPAEEPVQPEVTAEPETPAEPEPAAEPKKQRIKADLEEIAAKNEYVSVFEKLADTSKPKTPEKPKRKKRKGDDDEFKTRNKILEQQLRKDINVDIKPVYTEEELEEIERQQLEEEESQYDIDYDEYEDYYDDEGMM